MTQWSRLRMVGSVLAVALCALDGFAEADGERPNILWITCEDLSPRIGCYGDSTVATPAIDRLASQGTRYTHAFGVYGVCAPNRHSIIMGMYPTTTGGTHMRTWKRSGAMDEIAKEAAKQIPIYEATPPPEAKCFTEYLRRAGYYCTNRSKTDYQFRPPVTAWDQSGGKAHWRNRPTRESPFFSVFNFTVTHESGTFKRRSPVVVDPQDVVLPPYYPDTPLVRQDLARHYDNIAALDKQVAKVLAQLKEDGLEKNTIVFFFSDHGDGLPRAKRWVYDSGTRVPMVVRFPNDGRAGSVSSELVSFVDLAPTVLSLAGIDVPGHMHGQAFLGKKKAEPRKYVYGVRDRMDTSAETIRSVRDQRFRYVRNYRPDLPYFGHVPYRNRAAIAQEILRLDKANKLSASQWQLSGKTKPIEEFYDCETDPHEINNLIDSAKHAQKIAELRAAHEKWNRDYVDLGRIPERELIRKLWPPDGIQPTTEPAEFQLVESGDVILSCPTNGASIAYQIGKENRWMLYSKPIPLAPGVTLKAKAHRIGFAASAVTRFERPAKETE